MKAKRTKLAACFMCAVFALGAFAGCGKSDPSPEQPVVPKPEEPAKSPWTAEPVVKGTFYSDFGSNEVIGENWSVVNYGWGQNGVTRDNVGFTRSPGVVKKAGATGGIVVLNSYGDYYSAASKRGQGGCLISNRLFGPGKYEVRMKVVPRFGPCSTAWSYYTNSYAITTPDGQIYGHNTADNIVYHEIDMECPRIGQGFRGWGGVAYEEYYQNEEDLREDGQGKVVNKSTGVPVATESPYNDGQWHTFAFEWRTQGYDYDESKGEKGFGVLGLEFSELAAALKDLTSETGHQEYDNTVRQYAQNLVSMFNNYASDLEQVRENTVTKLNQNLEKVNEHLDIIRSLNEEIRKCEIHGDPALELRDSRNLEIDALSELIDINVTYSEEEIAAGVMVEKLTISLDNINPDKSVKTDESLLVDGVFSAHINLGVPMTNPYYGVKLDEPSEALDALNKLLDEKAANGEIADLDEMAKMRQAYVSSPYLNQVKDADGNVIK